MSNYSIIQPQPEADLTAYLRDASLLWNAYREDRITWAEYSNSNKKYTDEKNYREISEKVLAYNVRAAKHNIRPTITKYLVYRMYGYFWLCAQLSDGTYARYFDWQSLQKRQQRLPKYFAEIVEELKQMPVPSYLRGL